MQITIFVMFLALQQTVAGYLMQVGATELNNDEKTTTEVGLHKFYAALNTESKVKHREKRNEPPRTVGLLNWADALRDKRCRDNNRLQMQKVQNRPKKQSKIKSINLLDSKILMSNQNDNGGETLEGLEMIPKESETEEWIDYDIPYTYRLLTDSVENGQLPVNPSSYTIKPPENLHLPMLQTRPNNEKMAEYFLNLRRQQEAARESLQNNLNNYYTQQAARFQKIIDLTGNKDYLQQVSKVVSSLHGPHLAVDGNKNGPSGSDLSQVNPNRGNYYNANAKPQSPSVAQKNQFLSGQTTIQHGIGKLRPTLSETNQKISAQSSSRLNSVGPKQFDYEKSQRNPKMTIYRPSIQSKTLGDRSNDQKMTLAQNTMKFNSGIHGNDFNATLPVFGISQNISFETQQPKLDLLKLNRETPRSATQLTSREKQAAGTFRGIPIMSHGGFQDKKILASDSDALHGGNKVATPQPAPLHVGGVNNIQTPEYLREVSSLAYEGAQGQRIVATGNSISNVEGAKNNQTPVNFNGVSSVAYAGPQEESKVTDDRPLHDGSVRNIPTPDFFKSIPSMGYVGSQGDNTVATGNNHSLVSGVQSIQTSQLFNGVAGPQGENTVGTNHSPPQVIRTPEYLKGVSSMSYAGPQRENTVATGNSPSQVAGVKSTQTSQLFNGVTSVGYAGPQGENTVGTDHSPPQVIRTPEYLKGVSSMSYTGPQGKNTVATGNSPSQVAGVKSTQTSQLFNGVTSVGYAGPQGENTVGTDHSPPQVIRTPEYLKGVSSMSYTGPQGKNTVATGNSPSQVAGVKSTQTPQHFIGVSGGLTGSQGENKIATDHSPPQVIRIPEYSKGVLSMTYAGPQVENKVATDHSPPQEIQTPEYLKGATSMGYSASQGDNIVATGNGPYHVGLKSIQNPQYLKSLPPMGYAGPQGGNTGSTGNSLSHVEGEKHVQTPEYNGVRSMGYAESQGDNTVPSGKGLSHVEGAKYIQTPEHDGVLSMGYAGSQGDNTVPSGNSLSHVEGAKHIQTPEYNGVLSMGYAESQGDNTVPFGKGFSHVEGAKHIQTPEYIGVPPVSYAGSQGENKVDIGNIPHQVAGVQIINTPEYLKNVPLMGHEVSQAAKNIQTPEYTDVMSMGYAGLQGDSTVATANSPSHVEVAKNIQTPEYLKSIPLIGAAGSQGDNTVAAGDSSPQVIHTLEYLKGIPLKSNAGSQGGNMVATDPNPPHVEGILNIPTPGYFVGLPPMSYGGSQIEKAVLADGRFAVGQGANVVQTPESFQSLRSMGQGDKIQANENRTPNTEGRNSIPTTRYRYGLDSIGHAGFQEEKIMANEDSSPNVEGVKNFKIAGHHQSLPMHMTNVKHSTQYSLEKEKAAQKNQRPISEPVLVNIHRHNINSNYNNTLVTPSINHSLQHNAAEYYKQSGTLVSKTNPDNKHHTLKSTIQNNTFSEARAAHLGLQQSEVEKDSQSEMNDEGNGDKAHIKNHFILTTPGTLLSLADLKEDISNIKAEVTSKPVLEKFYQQKNPINTPLIDQNLQQNTANHQPEGHTLKVKEENTQGKFNFPLLAQRESQSKAYRMANDGLSAATLSTNSQPIKHPVHVKTNEQDNFNLNSYLISPTLQNGMVEDEQQQPKAQPVDESIKYTFQEHMPELNAPKINLNQNAAWHIPSAPLGDQSSYASPIFKLNPSALGIKKQESANIPQKNQQNTVAVNNLDETHTSYQLPHTETELFSGHPVKMDDLENKLDQQDLRLNNFDDHFKFLSSETGYNSHFNTPFSDNMNQGNERRPIDSMAYKSSADNQQSKQDGSFKASKFHNQDEQFTPLDKKIPPGAQGTGNDHINNNFNLETLKTLNLQQNQHSLLNPEGFTLENRHSQVNGHAENNGLSQEPEFQSLTLPHENNIKASGAVERYSRLMSFPLPGDEAQNNQNIQNKQENAALHDEQSKKLFPTLMKSSSGSRLENKPEDSTGMRNLMQNSGKTLQNGSDEFDISKTSFFIQPQGDESLGAKRPTLQYMDSTNEPLEQKHYEPQQWVLVKEGTPMPNYGEDNIDLDTLIDINTGTVPVNFYAVTPFIKNEKHGDANIKMDRLNAPLTGESPASKETIQNRKHKTQGTQISYSNIKGKTDDKSEVEALDVNNGLNSVMNPHWSAAQVKNSGSNRHLIEDLNLFSPPPSFYEPLQQLENDANVLKSDNAVPMLHSDIHETLQKLKQLHTSKDRTTAKPERENKRETALDLKEEGKTKDTMKEQIDLGSGTEQSGTTTLMRERNQTGSFIMNIPPKTDTNKTIKNNVVAFPTKLPIQEIITAQSFDSKEAFPFFLDSKEKAIDSIPLQDQEITPHSEFSGQKWQKGKTYTSTTELVKKPSDTLKQKFSKPPHGEDDTESHLLEKIIHENSQGALYKVNKDSEALPYNLALESENNESDYKNQEPQRLTNKEIGSSSKPDEKFVTEKDFQISSIKSRPPKMINLGNILNTENRGPNTSGMEEETFEELVTDNFTRIQENENRIGFMPLNQLQKNLEESNNQHKSSDNVSAPGYKSIDVDTQIPAELFSASDSHITNVEMSKNNEENISTNAVAGGTMALSKEVNGNQSRNFTKEKWKAAGNIMKIPPKTSTTLAEVESSTLPNSSGVVTREHLPLPQHQVQEYNNGPKTEKIGTSRKMTKSLGEIRRTAESLDPQFMPVGNERENNAYQTEHQGKHFLNINPESNEYSQNPENLVMNKANYLQQSPTAEYNGQIVVKGKNDGPLKLEQVNLTPRQTSLIESNEQVLPLGRKHPVDSFTNNQLTQTASINNDKKLGMSKEDVISSTKNNFSEFVNNSPRNTGLYKINNVPDTDSSNRHMVGPHLNNQPKAMAINLEQTKEPVGVDSSYSERENHRKNFETFIMPGRGNPDIFSTNYQPNAMSQTEDVYTSNIEKPDMAEIQFHKNNFPREQFNDNMVTNRKNAGVYTTHDMTSSDKDYRPQKNNNPITMTEVDGATTPTKNGENEMAGKTGIQSSRTFVPGEQYNGKRIIKVPNLTVNTPGNNKENRPEKNNQPATMTQMASVYDRKNKIEMPGQADEYNRNKYGMYANFVMPNSAEITDERYASLANSAEESDQVSQYAEDYDDSSESEYSSWEQKKRSKIIRPETTLGNSRFNFKTTQNNTDTRDILTQFENNLKAARENFFTKNKTQSQSTQKDERQKFVTRRSAPKTTTPSPIEMESESLSYDEEDSPGDSQASTEYSIEEPKIKVSTTIKPKARNSPKVKETSVQPSLKEKVAESLKKYEEKMKIFEESRKVAMDKVRKGLLQYKTSTTKSVNNLRTTRRNSAITVAPILKNVLDVLERQTKKTKKENTETLKGKDSLEKDDQNKTKKKSKTSTKNKRGKCSCDESKMSEEVENKSCGCKKESPKSLDELKASRKGSCSCGHNEKFDSHCSDDDVLQAQNEPELNKYNILSDFLMWLKEEPTK